MSEQNEREEREMARISRLRDNDLQTNYEPHDIASAILLDRLDELGYVIDSHGDDKRESQQVYSGTGVDYEVRSPHTSETCGWFEVKSKRSEDWMGRLNQSHYDEYSGFAAYADEPVFLAFALVDEDEEVVKDWVFTQVPSFGSKNIVEELPFQSKGHSLYEIEDEYRRSWPWVIARLNPP